MAVHGRIELNAFYFLQCVGHVRSAGSWGSPLAWSSSCLGEASVRTHVLPSAGMLVEIPGGAGLAGVHKPEIGHPVWARGRGWGALWAAPRPLILWSDENWASRSVPYVWAYGQGLGFVGGGVCAAGGSHSGPRRAQ